jgi:hypothetical protein
MDPSARHTFVVRLWREGRARKELNPEWRLSVRHVGSGKLSYFRDLFLGMKFIQQTCLECSEPPADAPRWGENEVP